MTWKEEDEWVRLAEGLMAIPDEEDRSDAFYRAKMKAVWSILRRDRYYREQGMRENLINTVFSKKIELLKTAKNIKEIKEIGNPPPPHFNGASFDVSPYMSPEEELICWMLTMRRTPLNHPAMERLSIAFKAVFGDIEGI